VYNDYDIDDDSYDDDNVYFKNIGAVYAAYCIHVNLRNGNKWLIEKRYSQFRELRR